MMKYKITLSDERGVLEEATYEQRSEYYGVFRKLISNIVGDNLDFDKLSVNATLKIERLE